MKLLTQGIDAISPSFAEREAIKITEEEFNRQLFNIIYPNGIEHLRSASITHELIIMDFSK